MFHIGRYMFYQVGKNKLDFYCASGGKEDNSCLRLKSYFEPYLQEYAKLEFDKYGELLITFNDIDTLNMALLKYGK